MLTGRSAGSEVRKGTNRTVKSTGNTTAAPTNRSGTPSLAGTSHCGAGCTVGDLAGEWVVFLGGFTIAGSVLWANYAVDFACAYFAGIVFQYYSIAPMRGLSGWPGIKAALKADTISLVAYEIGMFTWMGLTSQVLFHPRLEPTQAAYWFMMQVAMFVGFLTAYPANVWLIKKGIKEAM